MIYWNHHRARGGWRYVVDLIKDRFHHPDGVRFVGAIEDELLQGGPHCEGPIREPWVGFVHEVPRHQLNALDLERLLKGRLWQESVEYCRGVWSLTRYQIDYLRSHDVNVPMSHVYYPTDPPALEFSYEKFVSNPARKLITVGAFLRNFQAIYDLTAPGYQKALLLDEGIRRHMQKRGVVTNESVLPLDRLSDDDYDRMFVDNLLFLNLLDASANTTVVECITRGTPILINKVGGVGEYLGAGYPLYYETLEEAARKAADLGLIKQASEYLATHPLRGKLNGDYFARAFCETAIYRALPLPEATRRNEAAS
ncbi:MAG TPA: hypothetical protein VFA21_22565 [Pyrinomonadaceae bacterium]|nr:hypothetical protein [Pyrinomonadaceae bacterium]